MSKIYVIGANGRVAYVLVVSRDETSKTIIPAAALRRSN